MTLDEQLNEVLTILSKRDQSATNPVYELSVIYYHRNNMLYGDEDVRMQELVDKLVQDGYVNIKLYNDDTERSYHIKHDGRAFLKNGGYGSQNRIPVAYILKVTGQIIVVLGTLAAGVYYLREIMK